MSKSTPLPMAKPWQERSASEAELLAPPKVTRELDAEPPAMRPIGSALAGLVERLGVRQVVCEKHGAYESTGSRMGHAVKREVWTGCLACLRDEDEAAAEARRLTEAQARQARLEESLWRTALPERFIGRTFDTFIASTDAQRAALERVRRFADNFERHAQRGTTLILSGGIGTGKSHLAGAVIQALVPRRTGLYVTTMDLIRAVRSTWRKDSVRSESSVLDDFGRVDLLVLDELGVQYGTDAEKTLLFEVLDRRYMSRKPSILLTNLSIAELGEFVGDRLFDRLRETGVTVLFDWESYRAKARAGSGQ